MLLFHIGNDFPAEPQGAAERAFQFIAAFILGIIPGLAGRDAVGLQRKNIHLAEAVESVAHHPADAAVFGEVSRQG